MKRLFLMISAVMDFGISISIFGTICSAIVSSVLVGLTSGAGFTFGFAAARDANRLDSRYDTLAVNWVNSLQLSGGFASPLLFSYLVVNFGYGYAWFCIALLVFLLILPLSFCHVSERNRQ